MLNINQELGKLTLDLVNISSVSKDEKPIADLIEDALNNLTNLKINIVNNNIKDVRNYKVSCQKANDVLDFKSSFNVENIVTDLLNYGDFGDIENSNFYNIKTFSKID